MQSTRYKLIAAFLIFFAFIPATSNASALEIQGHRGTRGLMPPGNTIPSYQKAIDLGVDTIEGDMRFTADRQVVMNHSPSISQRCQWRGQGLAPTRLVKKLSLQQVQQWDCHPALAGIQPPPTLKQLTDLAENAATGSGRLIQLSLEMKENEPQDVREYMHALSKIDQQCASCWRSRLIVQSFDWEALHLAKQLPNTVSFRSAFLFANEPKEKLHPAVTSNQAALQHYLADIDILSPNVANTSAEVLAFARVHRLAVITWTVNERQTAKHLQRLGVAGIITDFPSIIG